MKVRYVFPLDHPLEMVDHWTVPLLGGHARMLEEAGLVTGIEFTKSGLPISLAFTVDKTPDDPISKATITGHDSFVLIVRDHLKRAFSFLQCFFNIELNFGAAEVHHEPESPDEASAVKIPTFQAGRKEPSPLWLTFDFITRSLMAAEEHDAPGFISALATMARDALISGRYIDSFRFSFLLLESLFGGGKFKTVQLKQQFAASAALLGAIQQSLDEWTFDPKTSPSTTATLLQSKPTPQQVADHFVDMRGHYFHGNLAKPDAWHPAKQDEATTLASIAVSVVQVIASDAAAPMFEQKYSERHLSEAKAAGAIVKMEVTSLFRLPGDGELIHQSKHIVNVPGTKVTSIMAMEVAWRSIQSLREQIPVARLHSIRATNKADGQEVFEVRIHTEPDGPIISAPSKEKAS